VESKKTNEKTNYQKAESDINTENKLMVARGKGMGKMGEGE